MQNEIAPRFRGLADTRRPLSQTRIPVRRRPRFSRAALLPDRILPASRILRANRFFHARYLFAINIFRAVLQIRFREFRDWFYGLRHSSDQGGAAGCGQGRTLPFSQPPCHRVRRLRVLKVY